MLVLPAVSDAPLCATDRFDMSLSRDVRDYSSYSREVTSSRVTTSSTSAAAAGKGSYSVGY